MIKKRQTYDIFISHSEQDAGVAKVVRRVFEEAGMSVFAISDFPPGKDLVEATREAIAESIALVVILTPSSIDSPSMMVEIGAASAWNNPVHLLLQGITRSDIPRGLKSFSSHAIADVKNVVAKIVKMYTPLSEAENEALKDTYRHIGIPSDQLATSPSALDGLVRRFQSCTKTDRSPERLLQEIMRLRKRSELPSLKRFSTPGKSSV